ncbi:hypothetical protein [Rhodococcus sp. USK13]|uniref:hypothetical protein n=1 Tax=Rhodococcus sp. USK13 TaxID=2806442 RepID=UPI001BCACE8D|nr:hypothetical protein [Rhodococcus sp. USK13]
MADIDHRPTVVTTSRLGDIAEARAIAAQKAAEAARLAAEAADAVSQIDDANTGAKTDSRRPRLLRRHIFAATTAALTVSCVLLLGALVGLALHHQTVQRDLRNDTEILDGARASVTALISPTSDDATESAQRILDDATGGWYDEFSKSKDAFAAVVQQSQTQASGLVSDAAIEKRNDDGSTSVLVAGTSRVTNAAGADQQVRTWRLRVDVIQVDNRIKLARVEVVP